MFVWLFAATLTAAVHDLRPSFAFPLNGPGVVADGFAPRVDPFTGRLAFHAGQDIATSEGTPVIAAQSATVVIAEVRGPYGKVVELDHRNGFRTRYGHLSRIDVTVGQIVPEGAVMGAAGRTGRTSSVVLHFEVWERDQQIDPKPLIRWVTRGPVVVD